LRTLEKMAWRTWQSSPPPVGLQIMETTMTIKEQMQADLDAAKAELEAAQAKVAQLEQSIANIPAEVENIAAEAWENVKQFVKNLI
jgi:predicted  nucleic acid-binding Zn-ribbon protein